MKLDKYSKDGNGIGQIELSDEVFGSDVNDVLIYELIKSANANLRQGTVSTKEKAAISGGGAKPWRQKGTGRARHGSTRSPIWRGGGTVFGPHPRSFRIDLPKKIKKSAYKSLFSLKAKEGAIKIIEDLEVNGKTREMALIGKKLSVSKGILLSGKADSDDNMLKRAMKNIEWFRYNNVKRLSGRDIFYSKDIIITVSALQYINDTFSEGNK